MNFLGLYKNPEQILDINDFGRRIYPQFLDDLNIKNPVKQVKQKFLADKIAIELKLNGDTETLQDDFSNYYSEFDKKNTKDLERLPVYIKKLLGKKFSNKGSINKGNIKITPIIDDRMFTMCWYGNDYCAKKLKEKKWVKNLNRYEYNYEKNELWNRFIFVDNRENSVANYNLLNKQNIAHTYDRWADNGMFYGITRYSFIVLTDGGFFSKKIFIQHLQTMYFQLIMLALLQRASLLRFSDEATKIKYIKIENKTDNWQPKKEQLTINKRLEYVQHLYEKYLHFVNKIYFREPTAQEQGIELYDMILKMMRIEKEVISLNRELDEIHNYISLKSQQNQNLRMEQLTKLGTIFLPLPLLISIFGLLFANTEHLPKYLISENLNITKVIAIFLILFLWCCIVFYIGKKFDINILNKKKL